jgi:hypothetical protein
VSRRHGTVAITVLFGQKSTDASGLPVKPGTIVKEEPDQDNQTIPTTLPVSISPVDAVTQTVTTETATDGSSAATTRPSNAVTTARKKGAKEAAASLTSDAPKGRKRKSNIAINIRNWSVPDSDDDYVSEPEYVYDKKGMRVVHDHWPSVWRGHAAEKVNNLRVNKTVSVHDHQAIDADDRRRLASQEDGRGGGRATVFEASTCSEASDFVAVPMLTSHQANPMSSKQ